MSAPQEADLRRLYERAPVGFYRSMLEGRFVYANPALVKMLGYDSVDEVLALRIPDQLYADPSERARLSQSGQDVIDGARVTFLTRSGEHRVVRLYGYIVHDERGRWYEGTAVDVTAQSAIEAHAEESEAALRMLTDQVPAIMAVIDRDLRYVSVRGSGLREIGMTPSKVVGRTMYELSEVGEPSFAHVRAALAGETRRFESHFAGHHLAVSVAPLREGGEGSPIVGVVSISVDITEARRLEARLVAAQKAESLGVLAGGVAHDFNNLLVAMLGNADLALLELPPGTDARAAVDAIRTAALRAAELTDQLLAVAGRRMTAATRVEVRAVVDELIMLLRPTFRPDLTVEVAIATDATSVKADPTQLRQVLLNLIGNARDAVAGRGRIRIHTRAVHADGQPHDDDVLGPPPGDHVVIEISDDGPGLDPALRRRIFEPFFTTKPRGHGLGLAAVLGIVRGHGGGIRVSAAPGATTFQIFWPAAAGVRARGARVLVVDDEPLVRDVVCRMLDDVGYAAVCAADGPTALALLAEQPVDAVVLDLSMPGMSGHDVLSAIRADRPALPVVVVSGQDRDRAQASGASGFLAKPFHFDELIAALDGALQDQ
jgi:PAS domain S-box-containing protein